MPSWTGLSGPWGMRGFMRPAELVNELKNLERKDDAGLLALLDRHGSATCEGEG